jgi:DNA-directed RNA polymerase subunit RPC12/RpoP
MRMANARAAACLAAASVVLAALAGDAVGVFCKYCGQEARDARSLLTSPCPKHPSGFAKGKHALFEGESRSEYACVNCGQTARSLKALVTAACPKHPSGFAKGRHVAYEGSAKARYTCKLCGQTAGSIRALVTSPCPKHPDGFAKGRHAPAR